MNRKKIKAEAREILKDNFWLIFKPYLILFLISILLSVIFDIENQIDNWKITFNFITSLITYPITIGITSFILKVVRKETPETNDIFKYYSKFIYVTGLFLLIIIFVSLWSLLLIIPGIIASISYTMSPYLMVDGTEDPLECIKKSKKLMHGYKLDYFTFILSFFGWLLISFFAFWYVIPYIALSEALYYEELKKITKID